MSMFVEALTSGILKVDWKSYEGALGHALLMTVRLTIEGFIGACAIGLAVALLRTAKAAPLRGIGYLYTEILKNMPFVTGIFIIYFGLTAVDIRFSPFVAGVLCISLFYGSYMAEIFRGGLQGVSHGQAEAAHALGLSSTRVLLSVILPQAVRLALPASATMLIDLLKGTAILVTIGGGELMTEATIITSDTFQPLEVYLVIGLIYLAICWPLSRLVGVLEWNLSRGTALSHLGISIRRAAEVELARR